MEDWLWSEYEDNCNELGVKPDDEFYEDYIRNQHPDWIKEQLDAIIATED